MRRRCLPLVALVALAACSFSPSGAGDRLIDAPQVSDGSAISAQDAAPDTSAAPDGALAAPACGSSTLQDDFTGGGGGPCAPWGNASEQNAMLAEGNHLLTVTPFANATGTHAGCTGTSTIFGANGVFLEVESSVTGATSYTNLHAFPITTGVDAVMFVLDGEFYFGDDGAAGAIMPMPYDPTAMRWWRLRPVATGVAGDISADGAHWTQLGIVLGTPPSAIRIDFGGGTDTGVAAPGMTQFANLGICPS